MEGEEIKLLSKQMSHSGKPQFTTHNDMRMSCEKNVVLFAG